jgi:hypothetical protein
MCGKKAAVVCHRHASEAFFWVFIDLFESDVRQVESRRPN